MVRNVRRNTEDIDATSVACKERKGKLAVTKLEGDSGEHDMRSENWLGTRRQPTTDGLHNQGNNILGCE